MPVNKHKTNGEKGYRWGSRTLYTYAHGYQGERLPALDRRSAMDAFWSAFEDIAGQGQVVFFGPFQIVGDRKGGILAKLEVKGSIEEVSGKPAVHIGYIGVDKDNRKKGYGAQVMQMLVDAADRVGLGMDLEVHPVAERDDRKPAMNAKQLTAFYGKFGFEKVRGGTAGYMVRKARSDEAVERLPAADVRIEITDLPDALNDVVRVRALARERTRGSPQDARGFLVRAYDPARPRLKKPIGGLSVLASDGNPLTRCAESIREIQQRHGSIVPMTATHTDLDDRYHGRGIGLALYIAAAREAGRRGAMIVAHDCERTNDAWDSFTSDDAKRIWSSRRFAEAVEVHGFVAYAPPETREERLPVASPKGLTFTYDGFPWPSSAVLYHTTIAYRAILRDGFKTRAELKAETGVYVQATGGGTNEAISFALDRRVNEAIVVGLRVMMQGAKGEMTLGALWDIARAECPKGAEDAWTSRTGWTEEHTEMLDRGYRLKKSPPMNLPTLSDLPPGSIVHQTWIDIVKPLEVSDTHTQAQADAWNAEAAKKVHTWWEPLAADKSRWDGDRVGETWRRDVFAEHYKAILAFGESHKECYNPLFFGTNMDLLSELDEADIGIVGVHASNPRIVLPPNAAVDFGYLPIEAARYWRSSLSELEHSAAWDLDHSNAKHSHLDLPKFRGDKLGDFTIDTSQPPVWTPEHTLVALNSMSEVRAYCTRCLEIDKWESESGSEVQARIPGDRSVTYPYFREFQPRRAVDLPGEVVRDEARWRTMETLPSSASADSALARAEQAYEDARAAEASWYANAWEAFVTAAQSGDPSTEEALDALGQHLPREHLTVLYNENTAAHQMQLRAAGRWYTDTRPDTFDEKRAIQKAVAAASEARASARTAAGRDPVTGETKAETRKRQHADAKAFRASLPDEGEYPDLLTDRPNGSGRRDEDFEETDGPVLHWRSNVGRHGSSHHLRYMLNDEAVAGLTLRVGPRGAATIDRVYTDPAHRRQGYAKALLDYAKGYFRSVKHSKDLTGHGAAWKAGVEERLPDGSLRFVNIAPYDLRFYLPRDDAEFEFTLERVDPRDRQLSPRPVHGGQQLVNTYAKAMKNGDTFPPVVLLERHTDERWGDELETPIVEIFDGNHRVAAARQAGVPLLAYVGRKPGTPTLITGASVVEERLPSEQSTWTVHGYKITYDDLWNISPRIDERGTEGADEAASLLNTLQFPLTIYRGMNVAPGKSVKPIVFGNRPDPWTWSRGVAEHFANLTHDSAFDSGKVVRGGKPVLLSAIVDSPDDVDWAETMDLYLGFSVSSWSEKHTENEIVVRRARDVQEIPLTRSERLSIPRDTALDIATEIYRAGVSPEAQRLASEFMIWLFSDGDKVLEGVDLHAVSDLLKRPGYRTILAEVVQATLGAP